MAYSKTMPILALLIYLTTSALIYIPNVKIDPNLLYQVQVSCNRLQNTLRATYGTVKQNDLVNYDNVYAADHFLKILSASKQLAPYTNIIVGANNTANSAAKSMIIGNSNTVTGSGNYVFSQNFNSAKAGGTGNDLVLDEWVIKLLMLNTKNYYAYLGNPKSYIYKW